MFMRLILSLCFSLRALVKYLDNVPESEIVELNIPTGIPLVYELDADLKPIKHYYLADEVRSTALAQVYALLPSSYVYGIL